MSTATVTDLRSSLAALLAPSSSGDPPVVPYVSDAAAPPVLVVGWGDPWLETETGRTGQCRYRARLHVWAVTSRLEPESGTPELEGLVSRILRLLAADPYPWAITVGGPGNLPVGGVSYFAAQLTVTADAVPNPEV